MSCTSPITSARLGLPTPVRYHYLARKMHLAVALMSDRRHRAMREQPLYGAAAAGRLRLHPGCGEAHLAPESSHGRKDSCRTRRAKTH